MTSLGLLFDPAEFRGIREFVSRKSSVIYNYNDSVLSYNIELQYCSHGGGVKKSRGSLCMFIFTSVYTPPQRSQKKIDKR